MMSITQDIWQRTSQHLNIKRKKKFLPSSNILLASCRRLECICWKSSRQTTFLPNFTLLRNLKLWLRRSHRLWPMWPCQILMYLCLRPKQYVVLPLSIEASQCIDGSLVRCICGQGSKCFPYHRVAIRPSCLDAHVGHNRNGHAFKSTPQVTVLFIWRVSTVFCWGTLPYLALSKCIKFVIGKKSAIGDKPATKRNDAPISWARLPFALAPLYTTQDAEEQRTTVCIQYDLSYWSNLMFASSSSKSGTRMA